MSYKIPPKSTQGTKLRIVARGRGIASSAPFQEAPALCFSVDRAFGEPDFIAFGEAAVERHSLWDKCLGFAVIVGISGSFWTGVGLLINHLLR